jgi:hypothetical protein
MNENKCTQNRDSAPKYTSFGVKEIIFDKIQIAEYNKNVNYM